MICYLFALSTCLPCRKLRLCHFWSALCCLHLDISRPSTALFCGLLVTGVQMLAGHPGPVLDIFYVNTTLSRQQILGTKATTQALEHIIKCGYYALALNLGLALPLAVHVAAVLGNWLDSHIVTHINDHHFKRMGRYVIIIIGAVYIAKGMSTYL
jgi:uncharacterized membrane protein YfcA